jgi:3-hydroxybutyryl-CoA dehydrogenase
MMAVPLPPATPVGVVGAGTMGAGIAEIAAAAGHPVLLLDAAPGRAEAARERIAEHLARRVARGRLAEDERTARLARIEPVPNIAALAPAGLVIEAIVEQLEVKQRLFLKLEAVVAAETVLATNTSSLSITAIAAPLARPARVAGLHFFNPVPAMRLVEVVRGLETDPAVIDTATATVLAWGKEPIVVPSWPGFLVNRVARPFYAEPLRLVQEGAADPATVDTIMREAGGFRMGPFELIDLIGLDVNLAVTRSVFEATHGDRRYAPSWLQEERVRAGLLGRKTGRGFFRYGDTLPPSTPAVCSGPRPGRIRVLGDLGPAAPLLARVREAGLAVERTGGPGMVQLGEVALALTDGRMATERQAGLDAPLVVFDLALDYATTTALALAKADQAPAHVLEVAAGLFWAIGIRPQVVDDPPGLVVMRTLAMLANEAAEAVAFEIASARDVDRAMRLGVNYPDGPLAWAERVGLQRIVTVLANLQASYGEERYRCSRCLRRHGLAGSSLLAG